VAVTMDECKHGLPQFLCVLGCNGNEKTAGDPGVSPSRTDHGMAMSPPRRTRLERAAQTAALPSIAKIAELLGGDVQGAEVRCPGLSGLHPLHLYWFRTRMTDVPFSAVSGNASPTSPSLQDC
jgi:hypothetical protein